jgi:IS30 family transposase
MRRAGLRSRRARRSVPRSSPSAVGWAKWEAGLIVGKLSRSAIATPVDRRSRRQRLIALPDGHRADQPVRALHSALPPVPAVHRLTLKWDQGSEMARHHELAPLFGEDVFIAPPASPWLRGTNENTTGLPRQSCPRASTCPSTRPTTSATSSTS